MILSYCVSDYMVAVTGLESMRMFLFITKTLMGFIGGTLTYKSMDRASFM